MTDEQVVLLADIASTGFSGPESGGVKIGDSVVVFAQGPIGLCATAGAKLMGASLIIGVDSDPVRLEMAKRMGADVALDFTQVDVVAEIKRLTGGGADVTVEALGTQGTFENALRCLRPGGTLSSLGVYSGKLEMPYDAFAAGLGGHRDRDHALPGRQGAHAAAHRHRRIGSLRPAPAHHPSLRARRHRRGVRPVQQPPRRRAEGGHPPVVDRRHVAPRFEEERGAALRSDNRGPRLVGANSGRPDEERAPTDPEKGGPHVDQRYECLDGNEAAARIAYAVSEVISIYPITPASPMAEHCDDWSAAGRPNLWGKVPDVVEMQSEAGAAGALHGALQKGALATTFTASQGLLLMIPNMFKIAGELTPAVIHVAARTIATHALSIFGDHSDVMHARTTGWAMLAAGSVQEAHDFALVAHAATLRARIPFLHFFDGFRTSHEINKIAVLDEDDIRALVRDDDVLAFRTRGLTPDAPVVRGTAQNPDVFFQAREASNPFHLAVPGIVQEVMDELATRTGRRYGLVDYHGAPDADRVIIVMGSASGAVEETVDTLVAAGEKVGMLRIRLFQPFPAEQIVAALPPTVRSIAVLDRTKEPGAVGEPLYLEVVAALAEAMDRDDPPFAAAPRVIGGRYGLSSKEMTPVDDQADLRGARRGAAEAPLHGRHLRRRDAPQPADRRPRSSVPRPAGEVQAVFFGLGSDGTVGANKASVKIIGESTDLFAQGYFVYDSKKSGSITVSHLRFGPRADPLDLSRRGGRLRRLPPVRDARQDQGPRVGQARRDVPAQRSVRTRRGLGSPARRRPAHAHRQGDRLLGDRRARGRRRGRDGQPDQHRHAAVLLQARRHPAARRGDRADQGLRREDVRQARRGGRRAQLRRHRPLARAPRSRHAGWRHQRASRRPRRSPTTSPTSSPGSPRD